MMKKIWSGFIILMLAWACTSDRNKAGNDNLLENTPFTGESIVLTDDQVSALKIAIGTIQYESISKTVRANGYVDVPPQGKAVISPMITGYVKKANVILGEYVAKGQVLAELQSMEFIEMQQQYIEMAARNNYLREEYERQKLLREGDAVSKKAFVLSESEFRSNQAIMEGLRAKLQLVGVSISQLDGGNLSELYHLKAPIPGIVTRENIAIGQHVSPAEELYQIVNQSHLHIELNVYERDMAGIRKGQQVKFEVPGLGNQLFTGEVYLVGRNLSEERRSVNVHVHFDESLAPFAVGMYATAVIETEEVRSSVVPASAIVKDGQDAFIFKVSKDGHSTYRFTKVPVGIGTELESIVELTSLDQIKETDTLVANGAFYLLNAFLVHEEYN